MTNPDHLGTTDRVRQLASEHVSENVSVDTILHALGAGSFGVLMILFALPNAVIPGLSFILGAPVVLFALQLALGRKTVWLPGLMRRQVIGAALFSRIVARVIQFLVWVDRRAVPRWLWLVTGRGERLLGFYIALIAVVLMVPIPFGNLLPALGISFMAVGLIERDGKAAAFGMLLGALGAAYIIGALVIGVEVVRRMFTFF